MKLLRRRTTDPEPAGEVDVEDALGDGGTTAKGRPTPKRRDSAPRRGPITEPPRTRKEAYKWQKQRARTSAPTGKPMTADERRAAMRRGDPAVLPRRDQGPERKLARDWVDSRRMLSNFLLILFPVMILGIVVPYLNVVVIALLVIFLGEWYITGRRIRALAQERIGKVGQGPWALGFYAGSRAYMPRRWRLPKPQVSVGDPI